MYVCFSWVRQRNHLKVFKRASVYGEPYQCAVFMPSLQACRTGIDVQQIERLVEFNFKYVRVSADEELWRHGIYRASYACVIVARIASDVLHEHFGVLTFPSQSLPEHAPQVAPVAVAVDGSESAEFCQLLCHFKRPDVACVPYLIARLEVFQVFVVLVGVCVAYYSYAFHSLSVTCLCSVQTAHPAVVMPCCISFISGRGFL